MITTAEENRQALIRLIKNIAPDTEPAQLKPEDNIRQVLGIDSFDYLQFMIALDEQFGIQTPEEDYGKIQTMQSLIEYVGTHAQK